MYYVIAGKSESFQKYIKDNNYIQDKDAVNVRKSITLNRFTDTDTMVLLNGWWARSWAKETLKSIMANHPQIKIEYMDGVFGENERKTLKSDTIHSRFELLDL